jgi:hypothetical protein
MLPLSPMLAILCLEYLVVKVLLQSQLMSLQKSSHMSGVERHGAPPKDDGFAQNNHPRKSPFFQLFACCP